MMPVRDITWELRKLFWTLRYPVYSYRTWRKRKSCPVEGDWVVDCRGQVHQVALADGDDLILDDGMSVSWMHCCTHATPPGEHSEASG